MRSCWSETLSTIPSAHSFKMASHRAAQVEPALHHIEMLHVDEHVAQHARTELCQVAASGQVRREHEASS